MNAASPYRPRALVVWVGVALLLFAMPTLQQTLDFPLYQIIFLYSMFFWITQATSWNIFCGYAGYFSFGQGALFGAGVYTTAILVTRHDFTLLPALPLGGVVGALIALACGFLVFRLRRLTGEIFALFTLAVTLGLGGLANNWGAIDGGRGIPIGTVSYPDFLGPVTDMLYYLGLTIMLLALALAYAVQHSRFGFGLFAIRDDERVADSIGVPAMRYKLIVFTLNGLIAGVSGALHAVQMNFVSPPSAFSLRITLFVIVMSIVGGRRHWLGPVLGAALIYTINDRLVGAGHAELAQILLATVLIVAAVFLKSGIIARLRERPTPPIVAFLVVFLGQYVLLDASVITDAAIAMVVALVVLFVPDRVWDRLPAVPWPLPRGAKAGARGSDDKPEPSEDEDHDRVTHS